MIAEYSVNAYENNQVNLYAVQGESDSRTIIFNIIEKSGIVAATSNATPINKMLDLTGYDVTLTVLNSEESVVSGEILDAENGKVQFTLSKACSAEQGNFKCVIILTKNSEDLRIVGITLAVAGLAAESYEITIMAGESDGINITVIDDSQNVYVLKSSDKLILGVKRSLSDNDYALKVTATSADKRGDGYDLIFTSKATADLDGNYLYDIALQTAEGFRHIIPTSTFKVNRCVVGKEE